MGRINVGLLLGRLLLNMFTRWDFMTMMDNLFYICGGQTQEQKVW